MMATTTTTMLPLAFEQGGYLWHRADPREVGEARMAEVIYVDDVLGMADLLDERGERVGVSARFLPVAAFTRLRPGVRVRYVSNGHGCVARLSFL